MTVPEYLVKLKMLLGIEPGDTAKDARLTIALEIAIQSVLTYCKISVIPKALELIVLEITEDYYRSKYPTEFEQTAATVVSVKRGDVQTNFGASKPKVKVGSGDEFVRGYAQQLHNFRRLGW